MVKTASPTEFSSKATEVEKFGYNGCGHHELGQKLFNEYVAFVQSRAEVEGKPAGNHLPDKCLFGGDETPGYKLPSLVIDDHQSPKQNADKGAEHSDEGSRIREGMIEAKAHTKGWNMMSPPSVDQIQEKVGDSRALFWGDDHMDKTNPQRFNNALESLKKSGVDTVMMEGFREDKQKLVDDWLAAKNGSTEEKARETEIRRYLDKSFAGNDSNKIMDMMTGIKGAGLKVLCAEPNSDKLSWNGDGVARPHEKRDENWSNVVQRHLANNPQSRVLLFAGSGHFTSSPDKTIAPRLAQSGVKTVDLTPPSQYIDGEIFLPK